MPRLRHVSAAVALALASSVLPGLAAAPAAPTVDVATHDLTGVTTVTLGDDATVVGVTWRTGRPGSVEIRWRTASGWTPWTDLDADGAADPGTAEARAVRPGTEPAAVPTGAAAVQARTDGATHGAELVVVSERARRSLFAGRAAHAGETGRARLGDVVTRRAWGANERWRSDRPSFSRRVAAVVVHHTVHTNDYSRDRAPAIIRGIYAFHTRSRGYSDIAYNLLVDRFGRVYEGRAGGVLSGRAVVGAHTLGFNEHTLGVAVVGNLDVTEPDAAAVDAVARVSAFAADTWRFDPRADVVLTSKGSPRYPARTRAHLPRVFGHRDTGSTACPGRYLYERLPILRGTAWRLLGPVIGSVRVTGAPVHAPDPVTITAAMTAPAAWRIDITTAVGGVITRAAGRGRGVRLAWNGLIAGLPAPPGSYRYTIFADDGVHGPSTPVSGRFDVGLPRQIGR